MTQDEALEAIRVEWMKLPDSKRDTQSKAAVFALCIMQDRPDLTQYITDFGDPYQHIAAFLYGHLA
jgi:hypothetical protein